jgi:ubiquinone/menaquinone biosynthesis C-methylase UbiE
MTRKWLTDAGEINFSPFFKYWGVILEQFFPLLEESIRSGQPPVNLYEWIEHQPEVSRYFQEGMIAITRYVKDDVVKRIPAPPGPARLLDVGGGHAMYSIALCQKHPQLNAVILDGAQALATGRAAIAAAGMEQRVTVQEGDFLQDDLGAGFQLALLFNIIHGLKEEQNLALLHRVRTALNPGGHVIILEQLAGAALAPIQEATTRILGMAYFHLLGGQVYTLDHVTHWLTTAGFGNIQRKTIFKAGSPLIIAERLP